MSASLFVRDPASSRYVAGGSTDGDWGFARWLNSKIATLLAVKALSVVLTLTGVLSVLSILFKA